MAVEDRAQGVGDVVDGIDVVELAAGDDGGQQRPVLGADLVTGEQHVFSGESDHPVILPMSGRKLSSTIAGILSMAELFASGPQQHGRSDRSRAPGSIPLLARLAVSMSRWTSPKTSSTRLRMRWLTA